MFDTQIGTDTGSRLGRTAADMGTEAQITVFLNRQRFEYGIEAMLKTGRGQQAVLHLAVRNADGSKAVLSHRALNLVGSTLRAGMRAGAVAYLGEAQFAVLLQDTDAWQAAAYARVAVDIVDSMQPGQDVQPVKACVGGILTGYNRDGEQLLKFAEAATDMAWEKPGAKLHLLHAPA